MWCRVNIDNVIHRKLIGAVKWLVVVVRLVYTEECGKRNILPHKLLFSLFPLLFQILLAHRSQLVTNTTCSNNTRRTWGDSSIKYTCHSCYLVHPALYQESPCWAQNPPITTNANHCITTQTWRTSHSNYIPITFSIEGSSSTLCGVCSISNSTNSAGTFICDTSLDAFFTIIVQSISTRWGSEMRPRSLESRHKERLWDMHCE